MTESVRQLTLRQVTLKDDLEALCAQIQPHKWAADNEMTSYQPANLRVFLANDQHILLVAFDGQQVAGVALSYVLAHPAGDDSLYIHELDTHPDYRRRGVATALMSELQKIAKQRGLHEVWVGTETTNTVADTFYRSLKPSEIEPSFIYAYKVK